MKVDEYGCLIPGCHLLDQLVEPSGNSNLEVAVYPNPTSDFLNFQLRGNIPKERGSFRVLNSNGQVLEVFPAETIESTFILRVSEWPSGTYFLQYVIEGEVLVSKKVIIMN